MIGRWPRGQRDLAHRLLALRVGRPVEPAPPAMWPAFVAVALGVALVALYDVATVPAAIRVCWNGHCVATQAWWP